MLLKDYEDLFLFTRVTADEARAGHPEFFDDERYRDIAPLSRMWLNVRGSPRYRKGVMYAKNFEGYSIIIWIRQDKVGGISFWSADYLVMRGVDIVRYNNVLSQSEDGALEEAQWDSWLALLEHLKYITKTLDELLS